jgi:hypothetical protein
MMSLGTVTNTMAGVSPPAGQYVVSLKEIEAIESDFGPQWRWIFQIKSVVYSSDDEAEEFIGEDLWGFSSQGLGPSHKARKWIEALMQRKLEEGEEVEESDIIGQLAVANVVDHERKDGTQSTKIAQDGGLSPYKKKGKKKPPPPPVDEDDDEDEDDDQPF